MDILSESGRAGQAIYEWGAPAIPAAPTSACWLENVGRFAIEVKGGQYTYDVATGQWYLHTPDGLEITSSPLQQADDSAMGLRNEIHRNTGFKVFIIPVVVFPDMAPDPAIEGCAQRTNVKVIWGAEHLLADLAAVARRVVVDHPPRANYIENEVWAVTVGADGSGRDATGAEASEGEGAGQFRNGAAPAAPTVEQLELNGAGPITIHHVEQLIVQQQVPAPTPDCGR